MTWQFFIGQINSIFILIFSFRLYLASFLCHNEICILITYNNSITYSLLLSIILYIHTTAFARLCESIIDFYADEQRASKSELAIEDYAGEVYSAYDILFNNWLKTSKESRVSWNTKVDDVFKVWPLTA